MRYFTYLSGIDYNELVKNKSLSNKFVVPLDKRVPVAILIDIILHDWEDDSTHAVIFEMDETFEVAFSFVSRGRKRDLNPKGYYLEHFAICSGNAKLLSEKDLNGVNYDEFRCKNMCNFLSCIDSSFLLYKVRPSGLCSTAVCNRIKALYKAVFDVNTCNAELLDNLLDMIEKFMIIKDSNSECLQWCKANAPDALRFMTDAEILENMRTAWLSYIGF